jgi:tripeptide aminopeptidase
MSQTEQAELEQLFLELADINEMWQQEDKVVVYVEQKLQAANVRYVRRPNGTLIGTIAGSRSDELGLCAHVDIAAPLNGTSAFIEDDRIKTDGTRILGGDDKTAVAAILQLAAYLHKKAITPERTLKLMFTVGEEAGLHGAAELPVELVPAEILVFDWVGGVNQVVSQSPAMRKIDITYTGKAAHAGLYKNGINAGAALMEAGAALGGKQGEYAPGVNFLIGQGGFGAARNQVPGRAWIEAELRSHNYEAVEQAAKEVSEHFETVGKKFGVQVDIDLMRQSDPFVLNPESELYERVTQTLKQLNLEPVQTSSFGCYDANIFSAHPGRTAVVMGAAYYNPHSVEEYVDRKEFWQLYEFIKLIATT